MLVLGKVYEPLSLQEVVSTLFKPTTIPQPPWDRGIPNSLHLIGWL